MIQLSEKMRTCRIICMSLFFILFGLSALKAQGGDLKWLRIGELQDCFSEYGTEVESTGPGSIANNMFWPAAYGLEQTCSRAKAFWLGARNFYDPVIDRTYYFKVVGIGPRSDADDSSRVFPYDFLLIGKYLHPTVIVDDLSASVHDIYDAPDEVDPDFPCDRMIVTRFHTSIGVTVTKKIMAWAQPYHDNYFIYDYVLKNTGIINGEGEIYQQTLTDFVFFLQYRYALVGEAMTSWGQGWGQFEATWGRNTVNQVIGTDPTAPDYRFRALYSWYGPHSMQPVSDDWGCPDYWEDGMMSAARYAGAVVLHADKSAHDKSDDICQPATTHYMGSDDITVQPPYSQYNEDFMQARYVIMTAGHAEKTHAEEVGDGYANEWGDDGGGYTQTQGFGPYVLEPGDSIHIVLAEGAAGLSREKNREVGGNWISWYNGVGTPALIMPDGSVTTDYDAYKREWVKTGEDSVLQTFQNALQNFYSGYTMPQPPPPPETFTVRSGGDRIKLSWSDNATLHPHFNGYQIYRAEGTVMTPETEYTLIFSCDAADAVHDYEDVNVYRGFDYFYSVVSRDDGSTNSINPGMPLKSSMFWTLTNVPAYLRMIFNVYPGDTDNNGVVNALDVLPIGLNFLSEGFARDTVSFAWGPSQAESWYPAISTFADANGDGTVDEKDVIGIGVNWGNTHSDIT
ncbi:hypothetical protein JW835_07095, partial [bacterium]|nr:hypothetical protein [bacterium]